MKQPGCCADKWCLKAALFMFGCRIQIISASFEDDIISHSVEIHGENPDGTILSLGCALGQYYSFLDSERK
jgi:hypothetical protein